jgi:hypothetical protein
MSPSNRATLSAFGPSSSSVPSATASSLRSRSAKLKTVRIAAGPSTTSYLELIAHPRRRYRHPNLLRHFDPENSKVRALSRQPPSRASSRRFPPWLPPRDPNPFRIAAQEDLGGPAYCWGFILQTRCGPEKFQDAGAFLVSSPKASTIMPARRRYRRDRQPQCFTYAVLRRLSTLGRMIKRATVKITTV